MTQGLAWLETLAQDIRLAVRTLRKSPAFLAVVVLSLALGIAANSTIFSVTDTLFYRPLPYDHPERLAVIWETQKNNPGMSQPAPIAEMLDWKEQNHVFEDIALTSSNEDGILSGVSGPSASPCRMSLRTFSLNLGCARSSAGSLPRRRCRTTRRPSSSARHSGRHTFTMS